MPLRDGELAVLRPRDSEALLDEEAFEREELHAVLGRAVAERRRAGARGGVDVAAAAGGCSSWAAAAWRCRASSRRWRGAGAGHRLGGRRAGARAAQRRAQRRARSRRTGARGARRDALVERAPWDLVLAADVLYERRNVDVLARRCCRGSAARSGSPIRAARCSRTSCARRRRGGRATTTARTRAHRPPREVARHRLAGRDVLHFRGRIVEQFHTCPGCSSSPPPSCSGRPAPLRRSGPDAVAAGRGRGADRRRRGAAGARGAARARRAGRRAPWSRRVARAPRRSASPATSCASSPRSPTPASRSARSSRSGSAPALSGLLARVVDGTPLDRRWAACTALATAGVLLLVLGGADAQVSVPGVAARARRRRVVRGLHRALEAAARRRSRARGGHGARLRARGGRCCAAAGRQGRRGVERRRRSRSRSTSARSRPRSRTCSSPAG